MITDATHLQTTSRICPACQQTIEDSGQVFCIFCQQLLPDAPPLENRYNIENSLGKGNFGHTYLATANRTRKPVAIKRVLHRTWQPDDTGPASRFFERELSLLAELNTPGHPNIPEVLDTFTDGRANYLVMKYVTGKTLKQRLDEAGPLTWPEVSHILEQVLSAIAYMHSLAEPVVHGDIKPNNIIEDETGRLFLVDFGTARRKSSHGDWATESDSVSGTPGFASWDQWRGGPSPAGDIYALGMTAFVLMADKETVEAVLQQNSIQRFTEHPGLEPEDLEKLSMSEAVRTQLLAAAAAEPGDRPSADDWLNELIGFNLPQTRTGPTPAARPLYFPSGEEANTEVEFVALADQKRNIAIEFLYKDDILAHWLEAQCFRLDLAQQVREIREQNNDRREAFEFVLQVLDPNRLPAKLTFDPQPLVLNQNFLTRSAKATFNIKNASPAYTKINLNNVIKGVLIKPNAFTLEPNGSQMITISAPARIVNKRLDLGVLNVLLARLKGPHLEQWPLSVAKAPWWYIAREIVMLAVVTLLGLWIWSAVQYWLPCALQAGITVCPLPPFPPPALLALFGL